MSEESKGEEIRFASRVLGAQKCINYIALFDSIWHVAGLAGIFCFVLNPRRQNVDCEVWLSVGNGKTI